MSFHLQHCLTLIFTYITIITAQDVDGTTNTAQPTEEPTEIPLLLTMSQQPTSMPVSSSVYETTNTQQPTNMPSLTQQPTATLYPTTDPSCAGGNGNSNRPTISPLAIDVLYTQHCNALLSGNTDLVDEILIGDFASDFYFCASDVVEGGLESLLALSNICDRQIQSEFKDFVVSDNGLKKFSTFFISCDNSDNGLFQINGEQLLLYNEDNKVVEWFANFFDETDTEFMKQFVDDALNNVM